MKAIANYLFQLLETLAVFYVPGYLAYSFLASDWINPLEDLFFRAYMALVFVVACVVLWIYSPRNVRCRKIRNLLW